MNSKLTTLILTAALAVATLSTACGTGDERAARSAEPITVVTEVARAAPVAESYEAVGTVTPKVSAVLSSQTMGQVLAVHVREGDRVRAGQLLVEIDARDASAQATKASAGRTETAASLEEVDRSIVAAEQALAAAEAQASLAKVTFERFTQLYERHSVSRQEYDETEARAKVAAAEVESAKASLAAMRARRGAVQARVDQAGADVQAASVALSHPRVTAPFAGIVTRRSVEVGTMASPGTPLLTLEDERAYRLEASVEERFAGRVRLDDPVVVTLPALGDLRLEGRVGEITPAADPASRSVTVKIDLPATAGLRSGMYGKAEFAGGERAALTIPKAALVEQGQVLGIYVVDERGEAHLRMVTLGKEHDGRVEVLSGLAEGDRVVVDGAGRIADGRRVTETARPASGG